MNASTKAFYLLAAIALCCLASCQKLRGNDFAARSNRIAQPLARAVNGALTNRLGQASAAISEKFLDAIAHIESSGRSRVIGDGGKARGMFQLHRAAWEDARKISPLIGDYQTGALNPATARQVARVYLNILAARLERALGYAPTSGQVYAAFNLGFAGFKKRGFDLNRCPVTTQKAVKKLEVML